MKLPGFSSWLLFAMLCLIWGSSFVLMKMGLFTPQGRPLLSAWQVAALRMATAGLAVLPWCPAAWRAIGNLRTRVLVIASGFLGSFIPAFLFCLAETKIPSALAGMINALTPLFTILMARLLYKAPVMRHQWIGVLVGLVGCMGLFGAGMAYLGKASWVFSGLVVLATLCYAANVNMVRQHLQGVASVHIASIALASLIIPSLVILWATGYFSLPLAHSGYVKASTAASTLGVIGTAVASVIFYRLVKTAGVLFASMVTYGIPFVAIGWGIWYGEAIGLMQVAALLLILTGVYLVNRPGYRQRTSTAA
ncbi:MAG TPA: DMT family transporter, partial [Phnomibacter sp.]|nr:DMT family transporter [Phnomibacter sp.]